MRVLIVVDAHLYKTPDNNVWAKTIYGYDFWKRYLSVFDNIVVASRIQNVDYNEVKGYLISSGKGVNFHQLPMARGAKQYAKKFSAILKSAINAFKSADCAIIRLPSIVGMIFELLFRKSKKPYAIEVVVDPVNAFAENKVAQALITKHLKKSVIKANGVSYVTKNILQNKYPSFARIYGEDELHFESYYSSIILKNDYFETPRKYENPLGEIRLVHTANNMNNYIKGHITVINVVKELIRRKIHSSVCFIGDGTKREEFEKYAENCGVKDCVDFIGVLSSPLSVREKLIQSDLFIFPSHAEGLPRVLIEAMAVGLPCLSSPVDGIPELLDKEYMFNPDDYLSYADKIESLLDNTNELTKMSKENILKAREYEEKILLERQCDFYCKLRKCCEKDFT